MKSELIGYVGVDSGQLLLCDPCYIDSEWEKEEFRDIRVYEHKITKKKLTFGKDFAHYEEVIPEYKQTMNQLNKTGEWVELERPPSDSEFSYNACANATLSEKGYGQLNYKHGHSGVGVAFSTAFGDGYYPVVAHYMEDDTLRSVEVIFQNEIEY